MRDFAAITFLSSELGKTPDVLPCLIIAVRRDPDLTLLHAAPPCPYTPWAPVASRSTRPADGYHAIDQSRAIK
jgi:hypothetical protein